MEINVVASFPGRHENLCALEPPFQVVSQTNAGISIELMDGVSTTHIGQAIVHFVGSLRSAVAICQRAGNFASPSTSVRTKSLPL